MNPNDTNLSQLTRERENRETPRQLAPLLPGRTTRKKRIVKKIYTDDPALFHHQHNIADDPISYPSVVAGYGIGGSNQHNFLTEVLDDSILGDATPMLGAVGVNQ